MSKDKDLAPLVVGMKYDDDGYVSIGVMPGKEQPLEARIILRPGLSVARVESLLTVVLEWVKDYRGELTAALVKDAEA